MTTKEYITEKIKSGPLFKHWERDYSIFFGSAIASCHQITNQPNVGENTLTLGLFVYSKEICSYYRLLHDNEKFLVTVGEKLKNDSKTKEIIFGQYALYGDRLYAKYELIEKENSFTEDFVQELADDCMHITAYQLIMHRVIDYLVKFPESHELGEEVTETRKKYEKVYGFFEKYFEILCQKIDQKVGYQTLRLLTVEEFINFMKNRQLPEKLEEREELAIINCLPQTELFTKNEAEEIWKKIQENLADDTKELLTNRVIKGTTVYGSGKIQGQVQVITDYEKLDELKEGNILVVPSTLPKYEHFYHRAKAIITEEGGLLSHVAIFCREFKKPGIIGTKIATQVLKDGDMVEVDANTGIVKILKR